MMRIPFPAGALIALLLQSTNTFAAGEALFTYKGDGLTIEVTEWSDETGVVSGVIKRDAESWPFKGKVGDVADTIKGTFTAGGTQLEFTSKINSETDSIVFTTGGSIYNLKAADPLPDAGKDAPKPAPKPANPLANSTKTEPTPAPATENKTTTVNATNEQSPAVLKLKQHVFPDVSMGGVPAYTVLLPMDWSATGNVEWQNVGEVPFPQCKFEIKSPAGGRIRYIPQMTIAYSNAPGMGETGIPAPKDFPQWLCDAAARTNPNISNLKIIESHRNTQLEKMSADMDRATGANPNGMKLEAWIITFEYDEANVHQREEFSVSYTQFAPFQGINGFFTQTWSMFTSQIVSAPADKFETMKKELYGVAGTVFQTPGWFTHSQAVIAENSRRRGQEIWEAIRKRGEQINQVSDAEYQKYKTQVHGDGGQHDRINSIYETSDYKDTTGQLVNLPMHYKNVYSDGKGNYVLSNNTQDKPGELWNPIEPVK